MKRIILLTITLLAAAPLAMAQKANVRAAESIANQDKANFDEARALIQKAMESPETMNDAKTYFVAGLIEERQFVSELVKQQAGKPFDQTIMNQVGVKILPYMLKADSLDNLPTANGKAKPQFSKKIAEILKRDMNYTYNVGVLQIQNQKPAEALVAFEQYFTIKSLPMFAADKEVATLDTASVRTATIVAQLAVTQKQPDAAIELLKRMEKTPMGQEAGIYEQLSAAYQAKGDTTAYIATLNKGTELCPSSPYFLAALIDVYNAQGKTELATKYIKEALERDPNNTQLYIVMGNLYELKYNDPNQAAEWYTKALKVAPNDPQANYEYGRALFNQAAATTGNARLTPAEEAKANDLIKQALPALELAYNAKPDNAQYRYLLKTVYYRLKMNDKYEALEKLEK